MMWFAITAIVFVVAIVALLIWSLFHHEVLDDRELDVWVDELLADTQTVEADRAKRRAAGECSCTVPDTGGDNCLIADRRCPIHGDHHA